MWQIYVVTANLFIVSLFTISGIFLQYERMNEVQVIIIGAGPSGIAAATRLLENGVNNIVILEAENRIGGRINTVPFGDGVIDLGAQWVHGEKGNVVFEMANQHNVLLSSVITDAHENSVYIDSSGSIVNKEESDKLYGILEEIYTTAETELVNYTDSLGHYFNEEYYKKLEKNSLQESKYATPFLKWYEEAMNSLDASDTWFESSGHGFTVYKECEGQQNWAWKSGYSTILDLLIKKYPNPDEMLPVRSKTRFNTEVMKIKWNNLTDENKNKIVVECSDESVYIADHVIVTVSLGVLKKRAPSMFEPILPTEKLNAIKGLGFGTVDKIIMKFPYKWWPENFAMFNFLWTDDNILCTEKEKLESCWMKFILDFHALDTQPLALCAWISGPAARYMEQLSERELEKETIQLLKNFIGRAYNISVPAPECILRSSWSSNPHFYGSYSFRSMDTEALGVSAANLAEPVYNGNGISVLLFAGEATHSTHYSTVHGAIETGWREADRILKSYKKIV